MKRLLLALVAMPLLFASEAEAQGDWWWGVTYNVSVPSGNTKDFIDNTSWRGASLEARKALWGEYATHLRQALGKYKAATQPTDAKADGGR